jgi:putative SOS response-associated peptidase YedK
MCGRYTLTRRQAELIERFAVESVLSDEEELRPRFNIAPSQLVPVIINQDGKRVLATLKWGLIPFWAKNLETVKPVINARCETVSEKPFFRQALKKRRCLIPADGFYEWSRHNKTKIPLYIHVPQRALFALAGLWDEWTSPDGEVLRTCTIITTAANEKMSTVHDRMPVILRPQDEATWLDHDLQDLDKLKSIMQPSRNEEIDMYQVSDKVNSARNDLPEMVEQVPVQTTLF